ncbi:MAG TPA: sodium/solute symporter [Candidatus Hydrogenedentes bacterium]|nr:sodium/solute symporter [Candidatus Hydrogenedentota bacterium]
MRRERTIQRLNPVKTARWLILSGALCAGMSVSAQEAAPAAGLRGGLSVLDWAAVIAYFVGMVGIGIYFARRTKTSEEYYLGGRRMGSVMIGVSLFATMISTISYLAVPGEMMKHGPIYLTSIASIPIIYLVAGYLLIPRIARLPITSAYELLETRLGRPVRLMGSVIFLLIRLVWMGLVIFTASSVVVQAVGFRESAAPYVSVTLGAITVLYASLGGLRAVVLTDVIQAVIMFMGAIITILLVTIKMGGVGWFPTEWAANWDVQPFFSPDPRVRVTVVGSIIVAAIWWICTAGSDQMAIQRYLSTRDVKAARRAFLINNCADAAATLLLALLGFAILGFFRTYPEYLTPTRNLQENTDLLFPHFIVNFVGFGMAGLIMAAMLSAAMSSLSSGVNASCTVITTDILGYFGKNPDSEARKVALARRTSCLVGGVAILLSLVVARVPGNLIEITNKTSNLFIGPLFSLFFFALFVRFATPMGAVFGALYGFLAAFLISFGDLAGWTPLSWQWITPAAVVVAIITGTGISLVPTTGRSLFFRTAAVLLLATPWFAAMGLFIFDCIATIT